MSVKKVSVKNRCLIAAAFLSFMFAFIFSMGLYVSRMYFTSFYPMNYPYTLLEYFIFGLIHILILFPLFFGLLMILSKKENNIEEGTNNGKFSSKIYFLSAGIVLAHLHWNIFIESVVAKYCFSHLYYFIASARQSFFCHFPRQRMHCVVVAYW